MGLTYITNIKNPVVKKVLNDIQEDISTSSSNVCSNVSSNVQTIRIGNIKSRNCPVIMENVTNSTTSSISANCIQSSEFKNMMNDIVNDHLNKLRSTGDTKTADQINSAIKTNVNVSQLSSCMATSFNNQAISFGDIEIENCPPGGSITFSNIGNSLVSNFMSKCIQTDSPGLIDAFNKILPLDPITSQPLFNDTLKNEKSSDELGKGAIIAISIFSVTLFLLLCFLVFYFTRTPITS
jgi:hypothetical protein